MAVALEGVARTASLLMVIVAAGCGASMSRIAPAPPHLNQATRTERLDVAAALVRDGDPLDVGLEHRGGLGAWAWPDGRVRITPALVDVLDAEELAAVVAHEMGHLRGGHRLHGPGAVGGVSETAEVEADRIGCGILAARGIAPGAMVRMLRALARGTGLELSARIVAAERSCGPHG